MSYPSEKESASITRRVQNIEEFIEFSLAPPVPPPPVPVPPSTPSDAKIKAREERRIRKEARKKEKKLKNQKRKEKRKKDSKKSGKRMKDPQVEFEDQDSKYLPNDKDFPDIRKFNEVTPSKQRGENLYAAALAAVRGSDTEPHRQRKEADSESESASDNEDDSDSDSVSEDELSHESTISEPEPHEGVKIDSLQQPMTSHQADIDDADDVIVFQPVFTQHHSPIGRPSPSNPGTNAMTSSVANQEVSNSYESIDSSIDADSLAYLQALHKKNTEQGWLSGHSAPSGQPDLSQRYPFMPEQSPQFDNWHPHNNSEANLLAGFEFGVNSSGPIFSASQGYQWGNSGLTDHVPPPPGFMDLPRHHAGAEDFQMNPNAFLPTSLRQNPPVSSQSPSILSMLYGSGTEQQDRNNWNIPPGYQMQHYGT